MSHWTTDTSQVEQFNKSASVQGYTPDEALEALGVKAVTDLRGPIGQALTELQKVKKSTGRSASSLAVLPDSELRPLYESDDLFQFGKAIRALAPWANDDKYPVTDMEIALVVQRGAKSGLDVLNPHEAQVWKDKRGTMNFQIAHALIAQWANSTHGGHTQPRYYDLTDAERVDHGIAKGDHALRCEFVMRSDIPLIKDMIACGWDTKEAREDVTAVGIATVSASDWNGTYFAPNARSKRWKLEKRAYADAIRQRFGTPSEQDIFNLRRMRGEDSITPDDWAVAQDETNGDARVRHAAMAANGNGGEQPEETPEETLARNRAIMHGDQDDDIIPGEIVEEKGAPPPPPPFAERADYGEPDQTGPEYTEELVAAGEDSPGDTPEQDDANPHIPTEYGEFVAYTIKHTAYTNAGGVAAAIKTCGVKGSLVSNDGECNFVTADVFSVLAAYSG